MDIYRAHVLCCGGTGCTSSGSAQIIERFEQKIKEETGIKTMKVGFNKVFGYYIEVSKGQSSSVPPYFVRKQTLVNAERYIVPELKEFENKILGAKDRAAGVLSV